MGELAERSWSDVARSVAWEFGHDIAPDAADDLLWNHTGYPDFWRTDNPAAEAAEQLRSYFRAEYCCLRYGDTIDGTDPVCEDCLAEMLAEAEDFDPFEYEVQTYRRTEHFYPAALNDPERHEPR